MPSKPLYSDINPLAKIAELVYHETMALKVVGTGRKVTNKYLTEKVFYRQGLIAAAELLLMKWAEERTGGPVPDIDHQRVEKILEQYRTTGELKLSEILGRAEVGEGGA